MAESVSATIAATQLDPTTWQYSITLNDTGPTTIGTFWFAWTPGQDYLQTQPLIISNPAGWTDAIMGGGLYNGSSIQWTTSSSEIQSGGTLGGFTFTSHDAPSQIFGTSVFHPGTPVTTSYVYSAAAFGDLGVQFVVSPACFRAGTRIRTLRGEVAVEALRAGDHVLTVDGMPRPVKWVGRSRIDCRGHKAPEQVWPVRIEANTFAPSVPAHAVYLSPDHAVFFDGKLVPVKYLINGGTVAQVPTDEVVYYHVELDRHDVLLAEGLPAESYLDTGDRSSFENCDGPKASAADFPMRAREAEGYAPLVINGAALDPIRQWIAVLARLGPALQLA